VVGNLPPPLPHTAWSIQLDDVSCSSTPHFELGNIFLPPFVERSGNRFPTSSKGRRRESRINAERSLDSRLHQRFGRFFSLRSILKTIPALI
jgi:hypothetical protein